MAKYEITERANLSVQDDDKLQQLMLNALDGDKAAYKSVLDSVAMRVRRYMARRMDHGPLAGDIEDIVQLVLIAVHDKRDSYDRTRPFMPWVFGIARYKLLEHLRANRRRLKDVNIDEIAHSLDVADLTTSDPATRHDVASMLDKLADGPREAVVLTKLEGRTSQEVARQTGLTATAVKVRVHRAMKALQRMAKED